MRSFGIPPFLEISSKGNTPLLNSYYVRVKKFGNRTIEEVVQANKVFTDGQTGLGVKEAQAKNSMRISIINEEETMNLTNTLWLTHLMCNAKAQELLTDCTGISDIYASETNKVNVETLWRLRSKLVKAMADNTSVGCVEGGSSVVVSKVEKGSKDIM